MKVTIYLNGTDVVPTNVREIRSAQSHILLALVTPEGISLYDRKSRLQHVMNWADIDELRKNVEEKPTNTHLNVVRVGG